MQVSRVLQVGGAFSRFRVFRFGDKCWFAHGRHELRTVPRLDRHPMAALNAIAEVIEALPPPSLSRKGGRHIAELFG